MDKQILCIKWGSMYGPEYVNCLYGMIARNITPPFKLYCFTDDTGGIRSEVECLPLPELGCEIPEQAPGKWPKQALWGHELFGLEGVALFIDLDSVIVSSIDDYFSFGQPDDVITARNWVKPWLRMSQTSVFRFTIGQHGYMLDNLRQNPQLALHYRYEQNYVSSCIKGGVKFWPGSWTRHFGLHCMGPWPLRYVRTPVLPKKAKIITFPGNPKAPDAIVGRWCKGAQMLSPAEHLRWVMQKRIQGEPWQKPLRQYLKPTAWVAEYWQP
ncbi:MAG: glycosyl transferase [Methylococcales bacterium]|nr:glycosyl transferase [Methylococcales bacterium]